MRKLFILFISFVTLLSLTACSTPKDIESFLKIMNDTNQNFTITEGNEEILVAKNRVYVDDFIWGELFYETIDNKIYKFSYSSLTKKWSKTQVFSTVVDTADEYKGLSAENFTEEDGKYTPDLSTGLSTGILSITFINDTVEVNYLLAKKIYSNFGSTKIEWPEMDL